MLSLLATSVQSHALVHVWFEADRDVSYIDFKDETGESATNQIVANPIQPYRLVHVYACDKDALTWLHLHERSGGALLQHLTSEMKRAGMPFGVVRVVDVAFWEHAVHSWRPVSSFPGPTKAARRAVQPDPLHRPGLFVAGEAFSAAHQGWADGALETAEAAARGVLAHLAHLAHSDTPHTSTRATRAARAAPPAPTPTPPAPHVSRDIR